MSTPKIRDLEFHELLALEPHGPDTYVAIVATGANSAECPKRSTAAK